MKLAFVVNQVATEKADFTTTRLAWHAANAGHDVAFIELGDFIYLSSGEVHARAVLAERNDYEGDEALLADVQRRKPHACPSP